MGCACTLLPWIVRVVSAIVVVLVTLCVGVVVLVVVVVVVTVGGPRGHTMQGHVFTDSANESERACPRGAMSAAVVDFV